MLDAAYAEYVKRNDYEAGFELVATTANTVMVRTFSKIYGLAGMRVGWRTRALGFLARHFGPAFVLPTITTLEQVDSGQYDKQAEAVAGGVLQLITSGNTGGDELSDLAALAGVHQFPARIKCATLSWHAALNAVQGEARPATTEKPGD